MAVWHPSMEPFLKVSIRCCMMIPCVAYLALLMPFFAFQQTVEPVCANASILVVILSSTVMSVEIYCSVRNVC